MTLSINKLHTTIVNNHRELDEVSTLLKNIPLDFQKISAKISILTEMRSTILEMRQQVARKRAEQFKNSDKDLEIVLNKCEKLYTKCIEKNMPMLLQLTPTEVMMHIFSYADQHTLHAASKVCQSWHVTIRDEHFWKLYLQQNFPKHAIQENTPFKLQYADALTDINLSLGNHSFVRLEIDGSNPLVEVNDQVLATLVKNDKQESVLRVIPWTSASCEKTAKGFIDFPIEDLKNLRIQLKKDALFIGRFSLCGFNLTIIHGRQGDKESSPTQNLRLNQSQYLATDEAIFGYGTFNQVIVYEKDAATGNFVTTPRVAIKNLGVCMGRNAVFSENRLIVATCTVGNNFARSVQVWKRDPALGGFSQKAEQILSFPSHVRSLAVHDHMLFVLMQDEGQLCAHAEDSETRLFLQDPLLSLKNNYWCFANYRNFLILGCGDGSIEIWRKEETGKFRPVQKLKHHEDAITSLKIEDNHLFTASKDGFLTIWRFGPAKADIPIEPASVSDGSMASLKRKTANTVENLGPIAQPR